MHFPQNSFMYIGTGDGDRSRVDWGSPSVLGHTHWGQSMTNTTILRLAALVFADVALQLAVSSMAYAMG